MNDGCFVSIEADIDLDLECIQGGENASGHSDVLCGENPTNVYY